MSDNDRRRRFIAYFNGPPMNGDREKLIKRSRLTKGRVAQYFDEHQAFGERAAVNLALRLGLREDFFLRDGIDTSTSPNRGIAHNVILSEETVPPTIEWGDLMDSELPERFRLEVLDDSMSDLLTPGSFAKFLRCKPGERPHTGRPVLVRDRDGNHYIRDFASKTPNHWRAVPRNRHYEPLDSIEDELELVAFMVGLDWA